MEEEGVMDVTSAKEVTVIGTVEDIKMAGITAISEAVLATGTEKEAGHMTARTSKEIAVVDRTDRAEGFASEKTENKRVKTI